MSLRIRTLSRAHRDVAAILRWLANERKSVDGASRWFNAYRTAVGKLATSPESFGFAPEDDGEEPRVRQFLFKTRRGSVYRGLFTLVADEIIILRVRGAGQPPLEPDELR